MNKPIYLTALNPEQYKAVIHSGSPLLILAGAGSGKTRVITTKIAYLIGEQGSAPESILAVTFTNKAAREMKDRATRLEPRAEHSVIRTFHSFGAWLLRRNANLIGLNPNFTIYDDEDAKILLSKTFPNLSREQLSIIAHKIARAKDYNLLPDSPNLTDIDVNPEFASLYAGYQERLRETGNLDFGDLILLPIRLLEENPAVKKRLHSRFQVIMVDEYQDSNRGQYEFLKQLTGPKTYLCVVGDDDQSIYKFRGAEVQNILSFSESFPGTHIIRLERNYRSVSPVLQVADEIVSKNEGRLGKTLISERGMGKKPHLVFLPSQDDETAYCADIIKKAHKKGQPWSTWAILYRTNAQSLGFETEFLHQKIPYKIVGSLKFYEREEIKDSLAFLALVLNKRDEIAFRRVINKPTRGIGIKSQELIIHQARKRLYGDPSTDEFAGVATNQTASNQTATNQTATNQTATNPATNQTATNQTATSDTNAESRASISTSTNPASKPASKPAKPENLLDAAKTIQTTLHKKARTGLQEFIHIIEQLESEIATKTETKTEPNAPLSNFIQKMLEDTGILAYHQNQDEVTGTQRTANLQELVNSASFYPATEQGLVNFLEHIELDRSLAQENENDDAVTLITVHNTKGLEFPKVIITGLEAGIFPRDDKQGEDLEEERRLMYVGCTRAMDELYLTTCRMRRIYGRTHFMEPSPFLAEINSESIKIIETTSTRQHRMQFQKQTGYYHQSTGNAYQTNKNRTLHSQKNSAKQPGISNIKAKETAIYNQFPQWKKGATVFHDDYGYGIISKTSIAGEQFVVFVQFEHGGEKRFLPKYQSNSLFVVQDS